MSTAAIDTSRTSERLSVFLSEIGASDPIDNYFTKNPTLDALMKNKKTIDGGRQITYPIDSGANSTVGWRSDYEVVPTTSQDTALTIVYPFVEMSGAITISESELREVAGSDHKVFDLIKHRRSNLLATMMDQANAALHAATQDVTKFTCLPVMVAATGAVGNLNASTDADWAATSTASGSFATQGRTDMNTLYNTLMLKKASIDTIITTQTVYESYEADIDADVRYINVKNAVDRGFKTLEFKGIPLVFDGDCASGVLYMLSSENTFLMFDTEGNFKIDEFRKPTNQRVQSALANTRGNLITNMRRGNGKLTGITA